MYTLHYTLSCRKLRCFLYKTFHKWRSLTLGVGSFHWEYNYLQEVPEKLAESNNSKIVVIGSEKGGMPILIQPETGKSKP